MTALLTRTSRQKIIKHLSQACVQFLDAMKDMSLSRNIPNISWNTGYFLHQELEKRDVKNILEIGTANGFSSMMLHLACPEAKYFGIEFSRHAFEELRYNMKIFLSFFENTKIPVSSFEPANFPPKITSDIDQEILWSATLYYGDARQILPMFQTGKETFIQFDCIFIDGAFRMTREFFDLSLPLLSPNGIIIIDDAIKYRWKMDGFHEYLTQLWIPYELIETDEDDGVMVVEKKFFTLNASLFSYI